LPSLGASPSSALKCENHWLLLMLGSICCFGLKRR